MKKNASAEIRLLQHGKCKLILIYSVLCVIKTNILTVG